MVRALIRVMYGTTLEPGSHAEAAVAYARAVELAPGRLVHRVELGRVLLRLGQPAEAAAQLQVLSPSALHTRDDLPSVRNHSMRTAQHWLSKVSNIAD